MCSAFHHSCLCSAFPKLLCNYIVGVSRSHASIKITLCWAKLKSVKRQFLYWSNYIFQCSCAIQLFTEVHGLDALAMLHHMAEAQVYPLCGGCISGCTRTVPIKSLIQMTSVTGMFDHMASECHGVSVVWNLQVLRHAWSQDKAKNSGEAEEVRSENGQQLIHNLK